MRCTSCGADRTRPVDHNCGEVTISKDRLRTLEEAERYALGGGWYVSYQGKASDERTAFSRLTHEQVEEAAACLLLDESWTHAAPISRADFDRITTRWRELAAAQPKARVHLGEARGHLDEIEAARDEAHRIAGACRAAATVQAQRFVMTRHLRRDKADRVRQRLDAEVIRAATHAAYRVERGWLTWKVVKVWWPGSRR